MSQQQEGETTPNVNSGASSSNNLVTDHTTNLSQQQSLSSTNGSDNMMIDTDSLITSSEKQLVKRLRQYETTAYSSVVSAFRAQGEITWEKLKVLTQLQQMLHISTSRHSTELLRSEVDVKIQQVAQSGVYNIIEREIEDKNNQFDFSLASETESENDNYVHHRVKHAVHSSSSNVEQILTQTKESKRGSSGRGRGRGKKRSSSTMVADSIAHSPKATTVPSDSVIIETPPNTPSKSTTTTSTTASSSQQSSSQNGTPAKKKRGRKSKKQPEPTPITTTTQPSTTTVVEPPVPPVQPVAAIVEPAQQISEELSKHLAATSFLTDDDINRASIEEIESIADRESNEIEELEKKLAEALDPNDTTAIVKAITKKKETLEKLIQKLETAEE